MSRLKSVRVHRLCLEALEDRLLPATFTVLNTADSGLDSLRQAILDANANPGPDLIAFNIGGGGVQTIAPTSALPVIIDPVTIDGTTQAGFAGSPIIELNGSSAGAGVSGLTITAADCTIRGLAINRFHANGIFINGSAATGNVVQGNYLGTDLTGMAAHTNGRSGIRVQNSESNQIAGNVISGSYVFSHVVLVGATTSDNIVEGNYIGVNRDGTAVLTPGASERGIMIDAGSHHNIIDGNVISLGTGFVNGIYLVNGSAANLIQGNKLGTNAAGNAALGNLHGLWIEASPDNRVIGNLASGNLIDGITIRGATSTGTVVQGNLLGTDVSGMNPIPNGLNGLRLVDITGATIGGVSGVDRNISSGNRGAGIVITRGGNNRVIGNYVGTDITGTQMLGNNVEGIYTPDSVQNELGGSLHGEGNLIAGNGSSGISILGGSGHVVQGNSIGTDVTGMLDFGNLGTGVRIANSTGNTIGGVTPGAANVISGNNAVGVAVIGNSSVNNSIRGNRISDNTALGIDLGANGVTLNDALGHFGPNGYQNFPVLVSALGAGSSTVVSGNLQSSANTTYALDFYANASADSSGHGEGQRYLGTGTVSTDSSGTASFSINLSAGVYVGEKVTATATDANGNTSEFSVNLPVVLAGASLQPDSCEPGLTALVVMGTSGDDHIVISPDGNTGAVNVMMNGSSLGTFTPTGRIMVFAQAGNDDVQIAGSIDHSAWLYGGVGNDRLKGAAGDDVLLGEQGDDLLAGGSGSDLLIGGLGADRIVGNGGDDILIAGLTSYDSNETALCHVMHEWTRTDLEYDERLAHLAIGDGLNDGFVFNASTIFNDTSEDILTGSSGLDWFVFDDILDLATDLNHEAFLSDLAFING